MMYEGKRVLVLKPHASAGYLGRCIEYVWAVEKYLVRLDNRSNIFVHETELEIIDE